MKGIHLGVPLLISVTIRWDSLFNCANFESMTNPTYIFSSKFALVFLVEER
jgi:hypothetical protein